MISNESIKKKNVVDWENRKVGRCCAIVCSKIIAFNQYLSGNVFYSEMTIWVLTDESIQYIFMRTNRTTHCNTYKLRKTFVILFTKCSNSLIETNKVQVSWTCIEKHQPDVYEPVDVTLTETEMTYSKDRDMQTNILLLSTSPIELHFICWSFVRQSSIYHWDTHKSQPYDEQPHCRTCKMPRFHHYVLHIGIIFRTIKKKTDENTENRNDEKSDDVK